MRVLAVAGGMCRMCSERIAAITARNDRPLRPKHADHAEGGERRAGEQRSDHARQVELDRVERDRVRHVLLARRATAAATDTPDRRTPAPVPVMTDSASTCQMRTTSK